MHFWTAKKIYKRVVKDADASKYNWITSATELVKVCKKTDFPEYYAKEIKLAILECFTYFENNGRYSTVTQPTDDDDVHYCYNTLTSAEDEGAFKEDDEKWRQEIRELFASVINARGGILY